MQKLVTIIGAMLLLAGVAAAGTFASLGSGSDDKPTISAEPLSATTTRHDDARREDRREDRAAEARERENEPGEDARGRENELRGRDNEPGEDVRGREAEPNDDRREAEPNDDRGGVTTTVQDDHRGAGDNSGPGSSSSGPGGSDDSGSGHGGPEAMTSPPQGATAESSAPASVGADSFSQGPGKVPEMAGGRRTILLVEDELSITEPLAAALERDGFDTRVAGTVEEALEHARRLEPDSSCST